MFYKCNSLISLPDISKWDITNVKYMDKMFFGCKSSLKLQDFYLFYKFQNNIIFELKYNNNTKGKTKIFDRKFINRNMNRCSIIYNNYEFELKEYFEDINNNNKDIIKFLLCMDKNINDMSYTFYKCYSLISFEYYQMDNLINELNNNSSNKNYIDSIIINSNINDINNLNGSINIYPDSKQK